MKDNFYIENVKIGGIFQQIYPNFDSVTSHRWKLEKVTIDDVYLVPIDDNKLFSKWIQINIFQKYYVQIS